MSLLFETDGGGKGGFGSQQGSRSTQPFFGSALRTASPESAVWDFNAAAAHDGWCQSLSEPSNPFPPNMNPLPPALYEILHIYIYMKIYHITTEWEYLILGGFGWFNIRGEDYFSPNLLN